MSQSVSSPDPSSNAYHKLYQRRWDRVQQTSVVLPFAKDSCKQGHHADFSCLRFPFRGCSSGRCLASSLNMSNCALVSHSDLTTLRPKSSKAIATWSSMGNFVSPQLVKSSASLFSSPGLYLKSRDNLALSRHEESSMLISINGHLVVDRLLENRTLAILSLPATR